TIEDDDSDLEEMSFMPSSTVKQRLSSASASSKISSQSQALRGVDFESDERHIMEQTDSDENNSADEILQEEQDDTDLEEEEEMVADNLYQNITKTY
ncbi:hypothetical protein JD844_033411, partial [Phrynosoma platyrhinos]